MGILSPAGVEAILLKKVLKLLGTALSQPNRRGGAITLEEFVTFLDEDDKTSKKVFEVLLLETCLRKRRDDPAATSQASSSTTTSTVRPSASSRSRAAERWPNLPSHGLASSAPVSSLLHFVDDSDDSDEPENFTDWRIESGMGLDPSADDFDEMLYRRIRDAEAAGGGGNAATSRAARVRRRQDRDTEPRSTLAELLSAGPVPTVVLPTPTGDGAAAFPSFSSSRPPLPFPNPTFDQIWHAVLQGDQSPACDSLEDCIRRLNERLGQRMGPSFRPLVAASIATIPELVYSLDERVPGTIDRLGDANGPIADRLAERREQRQLNRATRQSNRRDNRNLDDMLIETPFAFREDIDNGGESDSGFSFDWAAHAVYDSNGPAGGGEPFEAPEEEDLFEQFSRRRRSLANFRERNESSDGIVREGMEMLEMRRATRELDQIRDRLVREDNYDNRRRGSRGATTTSSSSVASTSSARGPGSGSRSTDATSGASTPMSFYTSATSSSTIAAGSSSTCPTPAPAPSAPVPRTSAWIAEEAARQRRAIRPLPARAVAGA